MTQPRRQTLDPSSVQIVHVINRCVRRAYLCGQDPETGIDYQHRKSWSRDRLEHLAGCFAIDVIAYSIMSNHTHQILRARPDIVATWSDEEVVIRWQRLRAKRDKLGHLEPIDPQRVQAVVEDRARVAELRSRLSDISWWMRYFAQNLAVRCNREDGVTGHFWEARFCHKILEDEADVLACMIYIDLNPIRAQMAKAPEDSDYTSVKDRIDALRLAQVSRGGDALVSHHWERLGSHHSGWLAPIEIDERVDPIGPDPQVLELDENEAEVAAWRAAFWGEMETPQDEALSRVIFNVFSGTRCSRKGVLPISLGKYLQLVDIEGRRVRSDKRGSIDTSLEPILQRLAVSSSHLHQAMATIEKRCCSYLRRPPVTLKVAGLNAVTHVVTAH